MARPNLAKVLDSDSPLNQRKEESSDISDYRGKQAGKDKQKPCLSGEKAKYL